MTFLEPLTPRKQAVCRLKHRLVYFGVGKYKEVSWHKQEEKNIPKAVSVNVECGKPNEERENVEEHIQL